ncbi:MAG: deoxyribonuclease IV [Chitinivibrionales bacterium]|nr:deoxyribonuclease IV [Chitinivibrionales bacterium]
MKRVGAHVSTSGGVQEAPRNAAAIGAKAFALFTKNQRQWRTSPYSAEAIDGFLKNLEATGIAPSHVLPHDSYLINLGNPDATARKKSIDAFIDELVRCRQLNLVYLNTHPGNGLESSEDTCLKNIIDAINLCLDKTADVAILLENTAGQGSAVGYTFEHLAAIIDGVEDKNRIGICFDTCHAFAAGYDLRTKKSFDEVMNGLDATIGMRYLKAMHLNGSKSSFGSRVDRHENLLKGHLGTELFSCIMNDNRFEEMPLILETIDETLWAQEIKFLYSLVGN